MSEGYAFTVNGARVEVAVDADTPLLFVLRNELGLTGTRFGCGQEQCGACMVHLDGEPAFSCTRTIDAVAGREVTTIEGLNRDGEPHPLRSTFLEEQAGQCGYCLSGILMSASALLDRTPRPSRADICAALDPHLCRCGVHNRIIAAIERAGAAMAART